jgi:hypothetical protein
MALKTGEAWARNTEETRRGLQVSANHVCRRAWLAIYLGSSYCSSPQSKITSAPGWMSTVAERSIVEVAWSDVYGVV